MGRHGIQVSQEGIPVKQAADYQKVLDDRWPFLDIAVEREVNMSKADWPAGNGFWVQELLTHDLGYCPAFSYRQVSISGYDSLRDSGMTVIATKTKIYLRSTWYLGDPVTPLVVRYWIRVFSCDITKEFVNPIEKITPQARTSAQKYGVKILKPGELATRIGDREMSSFSLNTNAKALSIQQTGTYTAVTPNFNLIINHGLGYPPTYFIAKTETAAEFDASTIYADPIASEDARILSINYGFTGKCTSTTTTLTATGYQSSLNGTYAYLILKDPAEVAG